MKRYGAVWTDMEIRIGVAILLELIKNVVFTVWILPCCMRSILRAIAGCKCAGWCKPAWCFPFLVFRALELLKLSWLVLNHGWPRRHNEVETNSGMMKEWRLTRVSFKVH